MWYKTWMFLIVSFKIFKKWKWYNNKKQKNNETIVHQIQKIL